MDAPTPRFNRPPLPPKLVKAVSFNFIQFELNFERTAGRQTWIFCFIFGWYFSTDIRAGRFAKESKKQWLFYGRGVLRFCLERLAAELPRAASIWPWFTANACERSLRSPSTRGLTGCGILSHYVCIFVLKLRSAGVPTYRIIWISLWYQNPREAQDT